MNLENIFPGCLDQQLAFLLNGLRPGQEIVDEGAVSVVHVLRHHGKEIFEVIVDLQLVCFGCLYDAVDDRAGLGTLYGVDVHPVLPAEREWTDSPFRGIVVHRDVSMLQKDTETRAAGKNRHGGFSKERQKFSRADDISSAIDHPLSRLEKLFSVTFMQSSD